MTMIDHHGTDWHTTAQGPDAELAELRRRLADAELRAVKLLQAGDFTQFSFEDMKRRAERAEAALQQAFIDALRPKLPDGLEYGAEGIADEMVDEIAAGTLYDELDIDDRISSWVEER